MFSFGSKYTYKKQATTSKTPTEYDQLLKFLMVGDHHAGKSCVLLRFADDSFFNESYISTIGVDFKIRTLAVDGKMVKVQLWDTTGQERFRTITSSYYRGAHGVVLCYSITERSSFVNIKSWMEQINRYASENVKVILIGTKCDLEKEREVTESEGKDLAASMEIPFFEVSAKTGHNVENAFLRLISMSLSGVSSSPSPASASQPTPQVIPSQSSLAGDDSDEEEFSDSELEQKITDLQEKSRRRKEKKQGQGQHRHKKTDVNVFRLQLSKIAEDVSLGTGEPTRCSNCEVIFNSLSVITDDPTKIPKRIVRPSSTATNTQETPSVLTTVLNSITSFFSDPNTQSPATTTTTMTTTTTTTSSSPAPEGDGEKKQYWPCEFCGHVNEIFLEQEEIPKEVSIDYVIEPAPAVVSGTSEANIIFCIDVSGSMCVTTELDSKIQLKGSSKRDAFNLTQARGQGDQYLPGQKRNVSYVSRLQCVQAAVEHQLDLILKEQPKTKVGIITFSNEVKLIGDGQQQEEVVTGDHLQNWDTLKEIGSRFKVEQSIQQSHKRLLEKLWSLEEEGSTALGPALLLAINIAGSTPTSKVICCTDGLANTGLGSIEGKETEYSPYYTELAEIAKLKGVTVSVISLTGTECSLENLSVVTDQTAGILNRVDPLKLTTNFASILTNPIVATGVMATVYLHRGLQFRNEIDDEDSVERNHLVKDLGNITATTECTFSYGFRPKSVVDLTGVEEIPFQLQLSYKKLNGMKCLRVVTESIGVTEDRTVAEANANVRVVGQAAAHKAGKFAKQGDYERAQMEARSAQRFLERTATDSRETSAFTTAISKLDEQLIIQRNTETLSSPLPPPSSSSSSSPMSSIAHFGGGAPSRLPPVTFGGCASSATAPSPSSTPFSAEFESGESEQNVTLQNERKKKFRQQNRKLAFDSASVAISEVNQMNMDQIYNNENNNENNNSK